MSLCSYSQLPSSGKVDRRAVAAANNIYQGVAQSSALNNPIVLRQIFTNLSTSELLTSCSLVNKTWYTIARTFVRSSRNDCKVLISSTSNSKCTACSRMMEFSQVVDRMKINPFNSISIVVWKDHFGYGPDSSSESNAQCPDLATFINMCAKTVKKLNVISLSIDLQDTEEILCVNPHHFAAQLFRENSADLRCLHIGSMSPLFHQLVTTAVEGYWPAEFPKLRQLKLGGIGYEGCKYNDFAETVAKGASNLKTFSAVYLEWALAMLPEKYLKMLSSYDISLRSQANEDECRKIGQIGPALLNLEVHDYRQLHYQTLITVLQQLLHSSQYSLQKLCLNGEFDTLADLFISLVNWPVLRKLKDFQILGEVSSRELVNVAVGSIVDYNRIFPALESVVLRCMNRDLDSHLLAIHYADIVPNLTIFTSPSVLNLELSLTYRLVNFSQMQTVFPAVKTLRLGQLAHNNLPPFDQVFSAWPNLEQLFLEVEAGQLRGFWPNADAQFCGIDEEEVETLWVQDEDFLSALHIVPIRPSLTTLSSKYEQKVRRLAGWC